MSGVYELFVIERFAAAHRLCGYQGNCANIHGHNWEVEVRVRRPDLDDIGMALDFRTLKDITREVLDELDHAMLNDLPAFAQANPTAERIARHVYRALADRLAVHPANLKGRAARMQSVTVRETARSGAVYSEST